jgi:hypothetical protein
MQRGGPGALMQDASGAWVSRPVPVRGACPAGYQVRCACASATNESKNYWLAPDSTHVLLRAPDLWVCDLFSCQSNVPAWSIPGVCWKSCLPAPTVVCCIVMRAVVGCGGRGLAFGAIQLGRIRCNFGRHKLHCVSHGKGWVHRAVYVCIHVGMLLNGRVRAGVWYRA